jgi:DNA polymerase
VLVVVDFSAIEARGLAWASGEEWRLEVFRGNGKIYEASAARTLGVPVESIKKGSKERGLGKLTELALGYQGWVNALINFGALTIYKLREEDLKPLVLGWREASPAIPALWRGLESAAVQAIQNPGMVTRYRCAAFKMIDGHLRMALPSGRNLWYRNARVDMEPSRYREGVLEPKIYFWGENEDGFWGEQSAYGGSITNNLVQGLCRDVMAEAMLRAEEQGFPLVLTVHDELVAEVDDPGTAPGRQALVDRLEEIMCQTPAWANGMPITADGWCGPYYHKE